MLRGALAGLVAGVAASFVMDRFQAAVSAFAPDDNDNDNEGGGGEEPATEKAADGMSMAVTGRAIPEARRPRAGQGVHDAFGIGLGIAYGIAAEFRPAVTTGHGAVFGLGTAALLDEGLVPASGLGEAPWKARASRHAYAGASHPIFGGTAEMVRARVAAMMEPDR